MSKLIKATFGQTYFGKHDISKETAERIKIRVNNAMKNTAQITRDNRQRFLEEIAYHYKMLETLEAQYLKDFGTRH